MDHHESIDQEKPYLLNSFEQLIYNQEADEEWHMRYKSDDDPDPMAKLQQILENKKKMRDQPEMCQIQQE